MIRNAMGLAPPNQNQMVQSGIAGAPSTTTINTVSPAPSPVMPAGIPPTGLIGSEAALAGGLMGGLGSVGAGNAAAQQALGAASSAVGAPTNFRANTGGITNAIGQGVGALDRYNELGQDSAQQQAALTGALGPEAQQAAYAQYQSSPAMQYQMEQMQRATEQSAAARGGLMGGNVLKELQRNASGIASQDYQNQFNNMSQVTNTGLQAGGQIGQLRGQQAGILGNLENTRINSLTQQKMNQDRIKADLAREMANAAMSAGLNSGQMQMQAGGLMARDRWNTGQVMSDNVNRTTSQVSQLLSQQGVQLSDMMSRDLGTMTEMLYQSGLQDKVDSQQLATILANITGGQASQLNTNYQNIGAANAAGTQGMSSSFQQWLEQMTATGAL